LPFTPFEKDFRAVEPFTMMGVRRLANLHKAVGLVTAEGIPGDIVECGVARGGSSALLGMALERTGQTDRRLWLLDSFEGMPEPSVERDADYEEARKYVGTCRGDEAEVVDLVRRLAPRIEAVTVVGRYEETLPTATLPPSVAVLHVDCDWYDPVKLVLNTFWSRVSPGGVVQIDDYFGWKGCRRAVDEFLGSAQPGVTWERIDTSGIWMRRPG